MAILNIRDAMDYIRLCDGDKDLRCAVVMVDAYYTDLKGRYNALKDSFALEVKNAYDGELQARETKIDQLLAELVLANWRLARVNESTTAYPEDFNDE